MRTRIGWLLGLGWVLTLALGCDGTEEVDAGPEPRDSGAAETTLTCETSRGPLQELIELAEPYYEAPTDEDALVLASLMFRGAVEHDVLEIVILELEQALGDPSHRVHTTTGGVEFIEGMLARQRQTLSDVDTAFAEQRTAGLELGHEAFGREDGATWIIDAVIWRTIGDLAMDLLLRCGADAAAVDSEELSEALRGALVIINDVNHGHEVARDGVSGDILRGAGVQP